MQSIGGKSVQLNHHLIHQSSAKSTYWFSGLLNDSSGSKIRSSGPSGYKTTYLSVLYHLIYGLDN